MWLYVPQRSTIARLLVDYYAADHDEELFISEAHLYTSSFILEIAKAGVRDRLMKVDERLPKNRGKCFYDDHKDDENGYVLNSVEEERGSLERSGELRRMRRDSGIGGSIMAFACISYLELRCCFACIVFPCRNVLVLF